MRDVPRAALTALILFASLSFSSCAGKRYVMRSHITHPVVLWLFPGPSGRCVLTTSANYLPVQRNDEIEFFLQTPDPSRCPSGEIVIENWKPETPVDPRDPGNSNKAIKVKGNARKRLYKYDIRVGDAKLDPEIEIMH